MFKLDFKNRCSCFYFRENYNFFLEYEKGILLSAWRGDYEINV